MDKRAAPTIDTAITAPQPTLWQWMLGHQAFWVSISVILIPAAMTLLDHTVWPNGFTTAFWKEENFFNITRNFAFIAIMALGQVAVMITGGIDLAVGLLMTNDYPFWAASLAAIAAGVVIGLVNGVLIAYLRLSPFVVTLGMLSIGRSFALAISDNKFFHNFGYDEATLIWVGGGKTLGVANPVWVLLILCLLMGAVFRFSLYGRHLYAIGGNEQAARLTGVKVDQVKVSAYVLSSLMTAIAAILMVGWLGSVTNGIGIGYELRVIASTVIGGVNLAGGEGGAYAAVVGAALIEIIRNSLLLAGVNPYWQGTFVGIFIIFAVLLERLRGRKLG
jgi:ribose transport system permease protein